MILEEHIKDNVERLKDIEVVSQMIELKMRKEKKTKFVQYYPDMIKQVDQIFDKVKASNLDSIES